MNEAANALAVEPIGIVVVNFGSSALLEANLASIDLTGVAARVVVVDNWSGADERARIRSLTAQRDWRLVEMPDNRGFGAAVNAGVRAARDEGCSCFLLLNPDATLDAAVLGELRGHVLRAPMTMVSPRIVDSQGRDHFSGARLYLGTGRIRTRPGSTLPASSGEPCDWLSGACVAVHQELWARLGGMAEDYFLYWEDVDLSYRALRAGATLTVRHDLTAVHDEGGTQGARRGNAKSGLYYFYNCRNRLLFAARHLGRRELLRWILATPAVSREILLRGGRRQLLTQPRLLLDAVRGSLAGLGRALPGLLRGRRASPGRPRVLVAHPGSELYGSDRVLLEAVSGLLDRADVVVALPDRGPLADELESRGAVVVDCPMPVVRKSALRPAGFLRLLLDAARHLGPAVGLILRRGADGVYVSTLTIPTWVVLARLLGRPVTVHVHEAERSASALLRRTLALPLLLAHRIAVNSRFSRGVLEESLPALRGRATVVYNGVPGPGEVCPPRSSLAGPVRLLYLGRLSPRKGPHVAIATLEELLARGRDVRLQLLGSVFPGYEWFEEQLRSQVREAGLADRVEFLGFQPDVWPVLAAADVVLVPSVMEEPFGNTAVEAALAGRPLVVSATSGLLEAADGLRAARAVPPGRPQLWADAVTELVDAWPDTVTAALDDARSMRVRYAPDRFRRELAELFFGADGQSR